MMMKHMSRKDRIKIYQSIHNNTVGARGTVPLKFNLIKGIRDGKNQTNNKRIYIINFR